MYIWVDIGIQFINSLHNQVHQPYSVAYFCNHNLRDRVFSKQFESLISPMEVYFNYLEI